MTIFKPIQDIEEKDKILQKLGCQGKFIALGIASVWGERKGLNEFLALGKILTPEYQIILVGLSETQRKALPSNMIGVTRTNNIQELAKYYAVADVFVNPTLEDTFPTTNIEALACGTPIVTYNTGGSPEILDESCGIIVEKGNIHELCEAIYKLKRYPIGAEECLNRANLFRKEDKYREYYSLYKQILKR
nr:glycosyltransferase [Clostridium aminobutyricum]